MAKTFTWITFYLAFFPMLSLAQEERVISGKIVDKDTGQPIPVVRISSDLERVSTDEHGKFQIRVKNGDHLSFVHLSYDPLTLHVSRETAAYQFLFMQERVLEMREVEVRSLPVEEVFKEAMMNATPKHALETTHMQNNLQTIMIMKELGYYYDMGAYATLMKNINTDGGVTFLSSNPSVGMIAALKRLFSAKPRVPSANGDPVQVFKTQPLWKNPLKIDSIKIE